MSVATTWLGDALPTKPFTLTKHRKAEVVVREHKEGVADHWPPTRRSAPHLHGSG